MGIRPWRYPPLNTTMILIGLVAAGVLVTVALITVMGAAAFFLCVVLAFVPVFALEWESTNGT